MAAFIIRGWTLDYYGSIAGLMAYLLARGRDAPILSDDEYAAALLVASEWIDAVYGRAFPGYKVGMRSQVRQWPRAGAYDVNAYVIPSDSVPVEVENATYEAAVRHAETPGSLSQDFTPGKYKSAAISGAVSVTFADFQSASDARTEYVLINQILAPILTGNGGGLSSLSGRVERV